MQSPELQATSCGTSYLKKLWDNQRGRKVRCHHPNLAVPEVPLGIWSMELKNSCILVPIPAEEHQLWAAVGKHITTLNLGLSQLLSELEKGIV